MSTSQSTKVPQPFHRKDIATHNTVHVSDRDSTIFPSRLQQKHRRHTTFPNNDVPSTSATITAIRRSTTTSPDNATTESTSIITARQTNLGHAKQVLALERQLELRVSEVSDQ